MESNENNEKIVPESILKNILFFSSAKEGLYDYSIPLSENISSFNLDKRTPLAYPFFEYLCLNTLKQLIIQKKKINTDILIITDQFLLEQNCKEILLKNNANHKKNIIICIQNQNNLKWNLIAFLDLENQIKNYFDINKKRPIIAKILSSNINSDEDDFILNDTMDKLETSFDFKSPDDIQFEVDSFNISEQPNTGIFLLNFISGLITQEDSNLFNFIKKLYEEGTNNTNSESVFYFNTFNNISEEIINICENYHQEFNEYLKNNNINLDDELNSDEEEEALKIMEKENEEAKSLMRQKERKMRQKLYKQKLREKDMEMYKEFGVIKEEDNESESESIDYFSKMKEEERIKKSQILNNLNVNININLNNNSNNDNNININNNQNIEEIKPNILKVDEDLQIKKQSQSEKKIKLTGLLELKEAIQEFESEQDLVKNTEENINHKKDEIKNNNKKINPEQNEVVDNKKEKKNLIPKSKKITKDEKDKKDKKKVNNNKTNNNIFKIENIELKKRASVPKSQIKVKKLQLDFKDSNQKLTENLKKSFTKTKIPEDKDLFKEKGKKEKSQKHDDLFISTNNNKILLTKKRSTPLKEINNNSKIIIKKAQSDNIINNNYKSKEPDQININININSNNFKNFNNNINNSKHYKEEQEKNIKILNKERKENNNINSNNIPINKEPRDNLSRKVTDLNNIINPKNLSKRNSNKLNKKSNSKASVKSNQESQIPYSTKKSNSSSNKSDDTNNSTKKEKEIKSIKNKIKPFFKEEEKIEEKTILNTSITDTPSKILPPPKIVEKNNFINFINKENIEKKISGNINIENITNDVSEKDKKSEISNKSYTGREKRNRELNKKNEKINPPGKMRNSHRYQYGKLDQEAADKICGCIGEQASDFCNIF